MDPLLFPTTAAPPPKAFDGYYDLFTGVLLSRRPSYLQNCDLPPPLTFSPIHKPTAAALQDNPRRLTSPPPADDQSATDDTSLLRALRLSQSRAREAELKAELANTRNKQMVGLLLKQSLHLSAHQKWVKFLEAEISALHKKKKSQDKEETIAWRFAIAMCIAGVGYALGRYRTAEQMYLGCFPFFESERHMRISHHPSSHLPTLRKDTIFAATIGSRDEPQSGASQAHEISTSRSSTLAEVQNRRQGTWLPFPTVYTLYAQQATHEQMLN